MQDLDAYTFYHASLHEEFLKHHGHKEYPRVTPEISDPSVDEAPGRWKRLLSMEKTCHEGKPMSYA